MIDINYNKAIKFKSGKGQVLATAIHHGHNVRSDLLKYFAINQQDRLREEDPYTGNWTNIGDHQLVIEQSRFECDLNRKRDEAIYKDPSQSWGLKVYQKDLPFHTHQSIMDYYDYFYTFVKSFLDSQLKKHPHFLVIDLHSYNHRRKGPKEEPGDIDLNPDFNLGTFYIKPYQKWSKVIECFEEEIKSHDFVVRHNVPFKGGDFSQWINKNWGGKICALTIEVKKIYMDEWTGKIDRATFDKINNILGGATLKAKSILNEF